MSATRDEARGGRGGAVDGRQSRSAGRASDADALAISRELLAEIRRHVEEAYPREGCGVLLGRVEDGSRRVTRIEPTENRWTERDDRYLVDPGVLRRLLEEEESGGPRVLGFYHSHPDAPAQPSETDLEHAWPWYHYLIVRVAADRAERGRAWELEDGAFTERELRGE